MPPSTSQFILKSAKIGDIIMIEGNGVFFGNYGNLHNSVCMSQSCCIRHICFRLYYAALAADWVLPQITWLTTSYPEMPRNRSVYGHLIASGFLFDCYNTSGLSRCY